MNEPKQEVLLSEYNQADEKGKAMLERIHGKETFVKPDDYTNLKTLADCCKKQNVDIEHVKVSLHPSLSKYQDVLDATLESFIIRDAIADNKEVKLGLRRYWPYFYEQPGVGFRFYYSGNVDTCTGLGSRLELSDSGQSKYFGEQFFPIHKRRLGY